MDLLIFKKQPLVSLPSISPSRYLSLKQCSLKEIWNSSMTPLLPRHPSAYLGIIIHRMFELAFKGEISSMEDLHDAWDTEINELEKKISDNIVEKHLVPLRTSVFNFEIRKLLAFNLIEPILNKTFKRGGSVTRNKPEEWVRTPDGKVIGRIDLVKKNNSGTEIFDLKTKKLKGESLSIDARDQYLLQLNLYAALFHTTHGEWPVKLTLMGIDQEKISFNVYPEKCEKLLNDAIKSLDETNELIEAQLEPSDFATPSPVACKYCLFRPACGQYWESRNGNGDWPIDIQGRISNIVKLKNGFYRIVLETHSRKIAIRGLSHERHLLLNGENERAVFCNLSKDKQEGFYKENIFTTSYSIL